MILLKLIGTIFQVYNGHRNSGFIERTSTPIRNPVYKHDPDSFHDNNTRAIADQHRLVASAGSGAGNHELSESDLILKNKNSYNGRRDSSGLIFPHGEPHITPITKDITDKFSYHHTAYMGRHARDNLSIQYALLAMKKNTETFAMILVQKYPSVETLEVYRTFHHIVRCYHDRRPLFEIFNRSHTMKYKPQQYERQGLIYQHPPLKLLSTLKPILLKPYTLTYIKNIHYQPVIWKSSSSKSRFTIMGSTNTIRRHHYEIAPSYANAITQNHWTEFNTVPVAPRYKAHIHFFRPNYKSYKMIYTIPRPKLEVAIKIPEKKFKFKQFKKVILVLQDPNPYLHFGIVFTQMYQKSSALILLAVPKEIRSMELFVTEEYAYTLMEGRFSYLSETLRLDKYDGPVVKSDGGMARQDLPPELNQHTMRTPYYRLSKDSGHVLVLVSKATSYYLLNYKGLHNTILRFSYFLTLPNISTFIQRGHFLTMSSSKMTIRITAFILKSESNSEAFDKNVYLVTYYNRTPYQILGLRRHAFRGSQQHFALTRSIAAISRCKVSRKYVFNAQFNTEEVDLPEMVSTYRHEKQHSMVTTWSNDRNKIRIIHHLHIERLHQKLARYSVHPYLLCTQNNICRNGKRRCISSRNKCVIFTQSTPKSKFKQMDRTRLKLRGYSHKLTSLIRTVRMACSNHQIMPIKYPQLSIISIVSPGHSMAQVNELSSLLIQTQHADIGQRHQSLYQSVMMKPYQQPSILQLAAPTKAIRMVGDSNLLLYSIPFLLPASAIRINLIQTEKILAVRRLPDIWTYSRYVKRPVIQTFWDTVSTGHTKVMKDTEHYRNRIGPSELVAIQHVSPPHINKYFAVVQKNHILEKARNMKKMPWRQLTWVERYDSVKFRCDVKQFGRDFVKMSSCLRSCMGKFSINNKTWLRSIRFCPKERQRLVKRSAVDDINCIKSFVGPYYWVMVKPNFFVIWEWPWYSLTVDVSYFVDYINQLPKNEYFGVSVKYNQIKFDLEHFPLTFYFYLHPFSVKIITPTPVTVTETWHVNLDSIKLWTFGESQLILSSTENYVSLQKSSQRQTTPFNIKNSPLSILRVTTKHEPLYKLGLHFTESIKTVLPVVSYSVYYVDYSSVLSIYRFSSHYPTFHNLYSVYWPPSVATFSSSSVTLYASLRDNDIENVRRHSSVLISRPPPIIIRKTTTKVIALVIQQGSFDNYAVVLDLLSEVGLKHWTLQGKELLKPYQTEVIPSHVQVVFRIKFRKFYSTSSISPYNSVHSSKLNYQKNLVEFNVLSATQPTLSSSVNKTVRMSMAYVLGDRVKSISWEYNYEITVAKYLSISIKLFGDVNRNVHTLYFTQKRHRLRQFSSLNYLEFKRNLNEKVSRTRLKFVSVFIIKKFTRRAFSTSFVTFRFGMHHVAGSFYNDVGSRHETVTYAKDWGTLKGSSLTTYQQNNFKQVVRFEESHVLWKFFYLYYKDYLKRYWYKSKVKQLRLLEYRWRKRYYGYIYKFTGFSNMMSIKVISGDILLETYRKRWVSQKSNSGMESDQDVVDVSRHVTTFFWSYQKEAFIRKFHYWRQNDIIYTSHKLMDNVRVSHYYKTLKLSYDYLNVHLQISAKFLEVAQVRGRHEYTLAVKRCFVSHSNEENKAVSIRPYRFIYFQLFIKILFKHQFKLEFEITRGVSWFDLKTSNKLISESYLQFAKTYQLQQRLNGYTKMNIVYTFLCHTKTEFGIPVKIFSTSLKAASIDWIGVQQVDSNYKFIYSNCRITVSHNIIYYAGQKSSIMNVKSVKRADFINSKTSSYLHGSYVRPHLISFETSQKPVYIGTLTRRIHKNPVKFTKIIAIYTNREETSVNVRRYKFFSFTSWIAAGNRKTFEMFFRTSSQRLGESLNVRYLTLSGISQKTSTIHRSQALTPHQSYSLTPILALNVYDNVHIYRDRRSLKFKLKLGSSASSITSAYHDFMGQLIRASIQDTSPHLMELKYSFKLDNGIFPSEKVLPAISQHGTYQLKEYRLRPNISEILVKPLSDLVLHREHFDNSKECYFTYRYTFYSVLPVKYLAVKSRNRKYLFLNFNQSSATTNGHNLRLRKSIGHVRSTYSLVVTIHGTLQYRIPISVTRYLPINFIDASVMTERSRDMHSQIDAVKNDHMKSVENTIVASYMNFRSIQCRLADHYKHKHQSVYGFNIGKIKSCREKDVTVARLTYSMSSPARNIPTLNSGMTHESHDFRIVLTILHTWEHLYKKFFLATWGKKTFLKAQLVRKVYPFNQMARIRYSNHHAFAHSSTVYKEIYSSTFNSFMYTKEWIEKAKLRTITSGYTVNPSSFLLITTKDAI